MSKFGDAYVLESGRKGHERLRVISEIHDGRTRELLGRAGLGAGKRFVEFGCGLGYVSRWAAAQGATVSGIDLSADQIAAATELIEGGAVDFKVASIYEHGLPPESVDVSYSRWLLVHLNQPVEAMRAIYAALKPGGVMVCEEADVSGVYAEPHCEHYAEMREIALEAGRKRGVSYEGGRWAHRWAREAGFELVHVDAYHPHYLDGPHKGFWRWTFVEAGESLVAAGMLGADKLAALNEGMRRTDEHPESVVAHCRMHQLIARKPL
jgi:SAM-dependent methyltransferase